MGKKHQAGTILVCSAKSTRGWRNPINKYSFGTILCSFLYCFILSNMPREMVSEIQEIQRSQQKWPAKETAVWIIQEKGIWKSSRAGASSVGERKEAAERLGMSPMTPMCERQVLAGAPCLLWKILSTSKLTFPACLLEHFNQCFTLMSPLH